MLQKKPQKTEYDDIFKKFKTKIKWYGIWRDRYCG